MSTKPSLGLRASLPRPSTLAALLLGLCLPLGAQPSAPPGAPAADPAPPPPPGDQTIQLSPFEVQTDPDNSYGALNSRSITAFNVALNHLPVSADIFDQAFMSDVGATTVESLIQTYSAGAGVSGLSAGASAFENQPGDRVNLTYTQLRGLQTPNMQRNSLLFVGTLGGPGGTSIGLTSDFDLERVDIIFGPEALLYDGGGAGGVINLETKQARLDSPAFGSLLYRMDEYGTKYGELDYGASAGNFAVRVALIDTSDDSRRINIGDHLDGQYVQLAGRFGRNGNTVVRLSLEQTADARIASSYPTLTTTGDKTVTPSGLPLSTYTGYSPGYLLASNQAGPFDNGQFNWASIDSYDGDLTGDDTVAEFAMIEADTTWSDWLSTQLSAGLSDFVDDHFMDVGALALYSPGSTSNPIPGNWTMGMTGANSATDGVRPYHGQGLRGSALLTNDLFGGAGHSQTDIGADLVDNRGGIIDYGYYQADSNWNIIYGGPATTGGRFILPKLSYTVNNGPLRDPLFQLGSPRITINGVNYVRAMLDPFNKALVSPQNPLGASIINGSNGLRNDAINDGIYATNYTQWDHGKWDTLAGIRLEHAYTYTARPEKNPPTTTPVEIIDSHNLNFNVGADYHVTSWLAPYFSFSDSWLVPPDLQNDPYGEPLPVSQGISEEVGLKISDPQGRLSGQLALYHSQAKNEEFLMTTTLETDINPSGLNGDYDSDSTYGYAANAESNGAQLTLTALPMPNWRMRLSAAFTDGTIQSTRVYNQLYNDQFHETGTGQVTYADGTPVYVPATYNSKELTVAAGTPGAVPLTVTLLSTPGSSYYANPVSVTGAILSSSNAAKVLETIDPVHGAILTGSNGLPISDYQLNPALTGVTPVGQIPVALSGEDTTGYPEFAFNFTNVYTIPDGWLKGLEIGGTIVATWENRSYYYYPNGLSTASIFAGRTLFVLPTQCTLNPILGYQRKFGRFTFTSQLNVYNLLNHYDVIVYPDLVTGWVNPGNFNANFYGQPRSYLWTNTLAF